MTYGSFVTPGWSYTSYAGWVSWGLMGGGILAAPPVISGMSQHKMMYDAFHIY